MVKSRSLLIGLLLFCTVSVQAQINRYMVFFGDKSGSAFTIDQPEQFLSEKAISRRQKQGIMIEESDLPVNLSYIQALRDLEVEVYHKTKWFNGVLVQEDQVKITEIQSLPFVSKVEFIAPGERLVKSTKSGRFRPFINRLSLSKETSGQNEMLSIDDMHELNYQGQGMIVAVFDGGFQGVDESAAYEPIFEGNRMLLTYDFVTNSNDVYQFDDHGSRVFSAIAGYQPDSFIGTAHQSSFILCVTEDVSSEYRIEEYNWVFAAELADSIGVDVINTSLGFNLFDDSTMDYTIDDLDGETAVITKASNLAGEKGILLVASVGNEGNNSWGTITPPADSPYVLAVGSVTKTGDVSGFSSVGPTADDRIKPDVVALGSGVSLVGSNGAIVTGSGTSFAAPLVAGLATGIWQANPSLTNVEVIEAIRMSGSLAEEPNNQFGYGVPDFLTAGNPVLSVDDIIEKEIKIYPNPFSGDRFFIDLNSKYLGDNIKIEFFDVLGNLISSLDLSQAKGHGVIEFNVDQYLPKGTYILRVLSIDVVTEVKVLKF